MSSGPDYSRARASLNQTKLQTQNPPNYQVLSQLIGGAESFQKFVNGALTGLNTSLDGLSSVFGSINDTLTGITDQLVSLQELIEAATLIIEDLISNEVHVIEVDTSGGAVNVNLSSINDGFIIIKDFTGNAVANNITLVGTLDATVNPVINTAYGFKHAYRSFTDGNYYSW